MSLFRMPGKNGAAAMGQASILPGTYSRSLWGSSTNRRSMAMSAEEAKNRTYEESNRVDHACVLCQSARRWQCPIRLKSQADRILARDN